jgi:hypothetical protein
MSERPPNEKRGNEPDSRENTGREAAEVRRTRGNIEVRVREISKKERITEWKVKEFDLVKKISELSGPIIEVAGPTTAGFEQIDTKHFRDRTFISNLYPGVPIFKRDTVVFKGRVDFQADATKLPLKDGSAAAVLCACLGPTPLETAVPDFETRDDFFAYRDDLRVRAIQEAYRVIKDGGFLVWEAGTRRDVTAARKTGFAIMQEIKEQMADENPTYWFVGEKNKNTSLPSIGDNIDG